MAETVSVVRRRIRLTIDDMNPNDTAIDSERMNNLMQNRMHFMAQEVGLGPSWVTGAVSVVVGTYQYTLPTSIQYERVTAVQLNSQEWQLERVTHSEFLALRDGSGDVQGPPTHFTLFEDTTQQVNLWLFPTPIVTDTLNVMRAQVPAALSAEGTSIPFSSPLMAAFEKAVAIDAVLLMDAEERERRKAVLDVIPTWNQEVRRAIRLERVRIGNLRRSDRVPEKWV